MITEEEAKTKWCPFARLSEMGGTYNRVGPAAGLYCIASACMTWRWGINPGSEQYPAGTRIGYCGLAGKPEVI